MGKLLQEKWMEEKRKEANFSGMRFKVTGKYAFTMTETKKQNEYCYEWENELVDYLKAHQKEEKEVGVYSYYKNEGRRPSKRYVIYYFVGKAMIQLRVQSESSGEKLKIKAYVKEKDSDEIESTLGRYAHLLSDAEKKIFQNLIHSLTTYFSKIEPNFRVRIATGKTTLIYNYSVRSILESLENEDN